MIVWGSRVTPQFRLKVREIAVALEMPSSGPDWLMACMAFETGRTFSPSVRNAAGSGAVGLIQFMPAVAPSLGVTVEQLAAMTAEEQLKCVHDYFRPYKGKLQSLEDVYMAILWPRALGKPLDYVLWDRATRPTTYRQNTGLDLDKDGTVTKQEAAAGVRRMYILGLEPRHLA